MSGMDSELQQAIRKWDSLGWPRPDVLLVSGSGLAVELAGSGGAEIALEELLPFASRGVEGHPLRLELLLPRPDLRVLYQKGRLHSYQGYDAHQTVFLVRLAALLGARILLMTNAAGGLNPEQRPGDLVLIRDHLNLIGMNPLRGDLPAEWGPQFPDMTDAYDPELRKQAMAVGEELGIGLTEGVYAGVAGPSYETPAEVEMLGRAGADLVGMSTVLEVIAARHLGLRCLCMSLVTNLAAGVSGEPMDHSEVLTAGREAAQRVRRLLERLFAGGELESRAGVPERAEGEERA